MSHLVLHLIWVFTINHNQSVKINRKNPSPLCDEKVDTVLLTRAKTAMRGKSGKHYKQCKAASSAFRSAAKHPPKHRPEPAVWVPVTELNVQVAARHCRIFLTRVFLTILFICFFSNALPTEVILWQMTKILTEDEV
jgi:hypothetical protein